MKKFLFGFLTACVVFSAILFAGGKSAAPPTGPSYEDGYKLGYADGYKSGSSRAGKTITKTFSHPSAASPSPAPQPKEKTVYVTRTGTKYHKGSCQYLRDSKIEIPLSEAIANGYTACSVCGG